MVNFLAVLVAAVVSMVLGMIYHNPKIMKAVFGSKKKMDKLPLRLVGDFILIFITAWVLAIFIPAVAFQWYLTAIYAWIFVAATKLGMILWNDKPVKIYVYKVVWHLISFVVMAYILSIWV
ncbi:DUF1761 domain-containing protein [Candidatus Woesearchaeota archaeon]|nr:DUF1761 domain-containing protein [Candidatus Woesearchaeota archaeon]